MVFWSEEDPVAVEYRYDSKRKNLCEIIIIRFVPLVMVKSLTKRITNYEIYTRNYQLIAVTARPLNLRWLQSRV